MKNKDYKVKINIEHGTVFLSITHNGLAWSSLQIKNVEEEIPLIISELQRHLTAVEVDANQPCPYFEPEYFCKLEAGIKPK